MGKTKHHYNNQTLIAPTQLKITELRIPKIYSEKYMYCLPNNRYPLASIRYVQLYYEPIAKKFLKDVSQKRVQKTTFISARLLLHTYNNNFVRD